MAVVGEGSEIQWEFVYEWRIKDFLSLSYKVDEFCESPPFQFGDASFCLIIFPNGETGKDMVGRKRNAIGHVGLYVCRNSGYPMNLDFTLGLKTVQDKIDLETEATLNFTEVETRGFSLFLQRSKLLARKSELMPSGDLTVMCKIKYPKSTKVTKEARIVSLAGANDVKDDQMEKNETKAFSSQTATIVTQESAVSEMVIDAITSLKERGGSSLQAIKKHIGTKHKVDMDHLTPFIRKYLKSAVVSGALVQTKGKGASGSFKLSASGGKKEPSMAKKAKKEGALKEARIVSLAGANDVKDDQMENTETKAFSSQTATIVTQESEEAKIVSSAGASEVKDDQTENTETKIFFSESATIVTQDSVLECVKENCKEVSTQTERETGASTPLQANKILEDLKEMFLKRENCDVVISVKGKEFPAHKNILAARSPVLASTFRYDMKEKETDTVDIEDCDPSAFPDFLCFLYCGDVGIISAENVFSLFTAADKYNVLDLREKCTAFMKENLSLDNFCETITIALLHTETELIHLATNFFVANAENIIKTVKWQSFIAENPIQGNELLIKCMDSSRWIKP